jgi:hypothetical protein
MPAGGRPRQLAVRTLLLGVLLCAVDDRPAQLTRVHQALVSLPAEDRVRLGVVAPWKCGPHTLTYRQIERTFSAVAHTMDPTPVPSFAGLEVDERKTALIEARSMSEAERARAERRLSAFAAALTEASVPDAYKSATTDYAVDWTDYAAWSRPGSKDSDVPPADPDATWGHRKAHAPGESECLFFGYYVQAAVMVAKEHGPVVPELIRRITVEPCAQDPPVTMTATLASMVDDGVDIGDVLADSGYSFRDPATWATPIRQLGASLVQDLHPFDRGPKGTYGGAIVANGSLLCPATPAALLSLGPLGRGATAQQGEDHDRQAAELARFRLGPVSAEDADGYYRVACPAESGKVRCPLKPASMTLGFDRPENLSPPGTPPRCCRQRTITVPVTVTLKTRQKHPYPSVAWRRSYARRTAAERAFSTLKDPASTDMRRGSCRLMGRTKNLIMVTGAVVVRNIRILDSFERLTQDQQRRDAAGLPRRRRGRRRTRLADLPVRADRALVSKFSDTT